MKEAKAAAKKTIERIASQPEEQEELFVYEKPQIRTSGGRRSGEGFQAMGVGGPSGLDGSVLGC